VLAGRLYSDGRGNRLGLVASMTRVAFVGT
jgi:hypothetical protein